MSVTDPAPVAERPSRASHLHTRAVELGPRLTLGALGGLTALAFALRVVGADQTLYADENFTYTIVRRNGLGGVWHDVYHTSITPPLHYFLAWLSIQFGGDTTVLVRLPSLILGTAIIPLVFLIGRRCAGPRAGLLAAALMTLGPFAIWYSDEARAYATMMFLLALSTLALMQAVDGGGRRWWALFALSGCAALWSHYTAVFVLAVEWVWAVWARPRYRREALVAAAAIVLLYLPWFPGFLHQRQNHTGIEVIDSVAPLNFGVPFSVPLQTLVGHPFFGLRTFPGWLGAAMLVVLATLILASALGGLERLRRVAPSLRSESGLMLLLTLATPAGLVLYAVGGTSLFLPRNLSASLPALAVLAAVLIIRLAPTVRPWLAAGAAAALLILLGAVTVKSMGDNYRRPAYREAGHYIDAMAGPRAAVVETSLAEVVGVPLDQRLTPTTVDLYLRHKRPVYLAGVTDTAAWRREGAGGTLFNVAPAAVVGEDFLRARIGTLPAGLQQRVEQLGGTNGLAFVRGVKRFPGIIPVDVVRYSGAASGTLAGRPGHEVISWSLGRHIVVAPGVARGAVDGASPSDTRLQLRGWALNARGNGLVDWVLMFFHGRLFAASPGGVPRPDVAQLYGPAALPAGFGVITALAPADHAAIRVFAVVGQRASELPWSPAAKRTAG